MRTYSSGLKIASGVTLAFFLWSFGPLFQMAAWAATTQGKGPGVKGQGSGKQGTAGSRPATTGDRFEKALEVIREKVGKAGEKSHKGEAPMAEIESIDAELKNEFSATERKIRDAHLPKEILDRHYKFVKHYEDNLAELKANLTGIEQSAKGIAFKKALQKTKAHLDKTKPPTKHVPLDPNKLPFRTVKAKERAPRLKKEEFRKDFPPQKKANKLASLQAISSTDSHGWTQIALSRQFAAGSIQGKGIRQKPIIVASNGSLTGLLPSNPELGTRNSLSDYLSAPSAPSAVNAVTTNDELGTSNYQLALATADLPTSDDLAATAEVQFTTDIKAKAQELGYSPVKIYEYVRNNIEFVPTYGSIQGADMCLQTKQCNAFDTASLLIALLRTSNLPARYVYGTIEIPIDKVKNWVGGFTDAKAALTLIASGGIPVAAGISGGTIAKARLEHVWVETYIPYGNYRGSMRDDSIKTWIPMDGSYKSYTYTPGFDITGTVPFNQDEYLSLVQSRNPVHYYQSQIQSYLDASMPDTSIVDVKGYREITQESFHFLPSTLPYITVTKLGTFSSASSNMSASVTFTLTNQSTGSTVSYTATTAELAGKRLTISYIPATSNDEALIAQYGGFLYDVPAYMLNLKPVLRLEGAIQLTGEATTLGSEQSLTVQFSQPSGTGESISKKLIAGAYYAVGMDLQGINENVLGKRNYQLNTKVLSETAGTLGNDDLIGEHLFILATTYHLANDKIYKAGAKLYNTAITRTLSEGITSFTLSVSHLFSIPRAATPSGINMDVAMDRVIAVAKDGNVAKEKAYMDIAGLVSSYHEHDIFERIDGFSSVSAVRALQVAGANGTPIHHINSSNISQTLPLLQVAPEIKTDIQNAVNAGKEVTIPQTNITINDWNGVGYIVKDPLTGSGTYMITGGLAGGDSTSKKDGMQVVQLHKEPNGWVKDRVDPQTRNTIATVALLESFEPALNEGWIQSAIVGGVNFCSTYLGVGQCTGLVYKAYKAAGIYLFGESLRREGGNYRNGLDIIWGISQTGYQTDILEDLTNAQKIYKNAGVRTSNDPLKGDIIFFDNTYIRDKTKEISEQGITHVGIVMEGPDSNGKITFAQASSSKGVVPDSRLNIISPDDAHNSIIRLTPTRANAAELFNGFGTIRNVMPTIIN